MDRAKLGVLAQDALVTFLGIHDNFIHLILSLNLVLKLNVSALP